MPAPAHGSPRVELEGAPSWFPPNALEALREYSERLSVEGIEQWLRDDVAPAIRTHESHPESGRTLDELEAVLGLK